MKSIIIINDPNKSLRASSTVDSALRLYINYAIIVCGCGCTWDFLVWNAGYEGVNSFTLCSP